MGAVGVVGTAVLWSGGVAAQQKPAAPGAQSPHAGQSGPVQDAADSGNGPTSDSANALPDLQLPDTDDRAKLILKHLNAVITWYHSIGNQLPNVSLPTDSIYQNNARTLAVQVVQSAFQSASADALLVSKTTASAATDRSQDFTRLAPQLEGQIAQAKSEIAAIGEQLGSAGGKKAQALQEQRVRLQGDLELLTAEQAAVEQLAKFSSNNTVAGGTALQRSIAQLQRNVPESTAVSPAGKASAAAPAATIQASTGLIGEASTLFSQAMSLHRIDQLNQQAASVEEDARQLRAPLVTEIHKTLSIAAAWAATPGSLPAPAGTDLSGTATDPGDASINPAPTRRQFDALTTQFKRLSAASLPLSQEIIDLDESRANLTQWRQSLGEENKVLFWKVLSKVAAMAIALGFLSFLSFLSNRLIFRYVTDIRRRRQVLILRRFILGFLVGVVLILGFVSEFSSLATFAGFITAGIAVGLQTILLSVAAYFFLIGRYGIRVGDRISIAGTTGDVIDVGLIRLYLMEFAGTGNDIFPTGRIVVFPNSVLFQATVPLYKQIPGTDYAWHEVSATLAAGGDAKLVQEQLLAAVNSVHESYRSEFERQHSVSSRVLDIRLEVPAPSAHLQFAATGLEVFVRYPVALGNVAKADEEITARVLGLIEGSDKLKTSINGTPQIRVAVKG